MFVFKSKSIKAMAAALGAGVTLLFCSQPVNSVSQVIFAGFAGGFIALSAGSASGLTSAPGISNSSTTFAATDAADPFTDTVNFGTLTNGTSGSSVATLSFRERANVPCQVTCSVSSYTTNNMTYNSSLLTGVGSELSFVTINQGAVSAGSNGNTSGFTYGSKFNGANTLATLNSGVVGPVTSTTDDFVTFTVAPSDNGTASSGQNWVQNNAVMSVPTGLIWGTNAGSGNFSITVQFAIFQGA